MRAGTNHWQRIDNTGCFPWVLRAMLLAWAIILPYAIITASKGWFAWSAACVLLGVWLTLRQRSQRMFEIAEMGVEVSPEDVVAGEQLLVTLRVVGEKASTVRWWSAEIMADDSENDAKVLASAEFAVDPEAESAPISELQMVLAVPSAAVIGDLRNREWWVQVTVETDRGRMESGRVSVNVTT